VLGSLADVVVTTLAVGLVGVALALIVVAVAQRLLLSPGEEDLRRCREELATLRREVNERETSVRQHYEQLLRDSAIKNSMMVGLWNAYRSGELSRCYEGGGRVRVLADGTVVCEKGEESYAVKVGEPGNK